MGKTDPELCVGIEYNYVKDIKAELTNVVEKGGNYVCSRLVPQTSSEQCVETGYPVPYEEFWNDTALTGKEWTQGVVALLHNPPQLESEDLLVLKRAKKALNAQLDYCQHLGISAAMFELTSPPNQHMAQIVQGRLNQVAQHFTFWVKVQYGYSGSGMEEDWDEDTWKWLNTFRKLCTADKRLLIVLRLNADIPENDAQLDRWKGEMVTAVSVPLSIFLTNDTGFPVLSKPHQVALQKFFGLGIHVILEVDVPLKDKEDLTLYIKYLRHIQSKFMESYRDPMYEYRNFSPGYENYLQSPLQPLMDNLESSTYTVFEMDPVKYNLYRDALLLAFSKKLPTDQDKASRELVVVVAGAGRGPLVNTAFDAASVVGIKVRVYALEKNQSAHVRLHHLNRTQWDRKVTIVCADMRLWQAPEQADVIVSELLGSFGDNELSPECLDGAQRFLKPDGIMLPEEYTSFLAPVMTHTLHAEAEARFRDGEKPRDAPYETTYVCFLTRKYDIAEPQELFKFSHPNRVNGLNSQEKHSNERYKTLEFNVSQDCDCHGFAGYFDSILFAADENTKVRMSILPETYSRGMQSWFPLYIPLKTGVPLKKGDKLIVNFWRLCTSTKVWYEWTVVSPHPLPIHNTNGRSSWLGLDLAQHE